MNRNKHLFRVSGFGLPSLTLVFLMLFLAAGASHAVFGEEEPQTVSFRAQGLPQPTHTDVTALAARAVLREFLLQHPHFEIEPFTMPQVGGAPGLDSGPLMAISAGIPPHAIYVNFRQSSTYIQHGFLAPMEILLARVLSDNPNVRRTDSQGRWISDPTEKEIGRAVEKIRERVPERAWPVVYRRDESGRSEETHAWALPLNNLISALFYRRDVFFEAGLDPDRPPETWEELMDYARRIRDPERQRYGLVFLSGFRISYQSYNFFVSNGARALNQDEDGEWRAAFDSREAAEAIHFLWRLLHEPFEKNGQVIRGAAGLTSASGDRLLEWERGNVGMQFGYLDDEMLATINPQLVGIAPMPRSPRGASASEINSRMLGIFSDATPEQQLAVMRYIWFITGEEAQRIRTRIFVENGFGQFVNPDLLEKFGYHRLLRRVPPGWQEAYRTATEHGVPEPYGRNTQHIYRWMSLPINRALEADFHGMDKEEAVSIIEGYMRETAGEVNLRVLGHLPPEEMQKRRVAGGAILALVAVAFTIGLLHIWRYFSVAGPPVDLRRNLRRYLAGFFLVVPGVALILMWQYLPLIAGGFSIAFMDYRIVLESVWVGVDNFANILFDEKFWAALGRSFIFVGLAIGLGFWPPILLAILLQEIPTDTAKYVYRTIFYLPSVLAGIVVMFLWRQMYNPDSSGVFNQILLSFNTLGPVSATGVKWIFLGLWSSFIFTLLWLPVKLEEMPRALKLALWGVGGGLLLASLMPFYSAARAGGGAEALSVFFSLVGRFELEPQRWLQDPRMAMLCIVVPMVWAASGPGCIIYLAALKSVPNDLYEAAAIDGAGVWHRIFYIVLPRLKFLIVVQFVAAVVGAFRGGEEFILVMTGGGPGEATTILSLEIFFRTFMGLEFGIGTAMAWLMGTLLIGFTAYQLKILSRAEFRAGGSK